MTEVLITADSIEQICSCLIGIGMAICFSLGLNAHRSSD